MLKVPVTTSSLKQQLQENPYFPSLYSISNVFDRFQISNTAFKIEKESFNNLTPPFIAYLNHQNTGKDFVLVTAVTENEVQYIAENTKAKKVSKEDFLKNWQNIVLLAEPDEKSGEKDFLINKKKEVSNTNKTKALITASLLIFALTLFFFLHSLPLNFMISATALIIIKMVGLAATTLLLVYEIDKSNALVKSICSAGKQTNCSAVLNSKASKILGMTWSEAGFFYFAATFLFLIFPSINFATKTFVLAIANCIAAPYILISVYYQWKVVKQWCPLCLTVQAVLAAELIWSIINFWAHPYLLTDSYNALLITVYSLLIPITAWFILKPIILKAKGEPVYKAAYKRLLYNPETFNHLLQQQATAPDGYQDIGITVGNPAAQNTIIKVCNPYCGPCGAAHPEIEHLIDKNKNLKVKIIFFTPFYNNDKRTYPAKHMIAIYHKENDMQTRQALNDWYLKSTKDYEKFAAKYPITEKFLKEEKEIVRMTEWCKEAKIHFTPTFFYNGKQLPKMFNIKDLKYFLAE